ncbi:TROVE domain-containing protein [Streptomyces roseolus]|uniref:TROVE domain-containing protein n=1 Tax=Streptomyces roseolus TaxID=67358 RepID=UPI0016748485|nr:TROVE domain-containing protein [Streptomyces roseolus]GGR51342.1 RNA-binding protein [Streptomyces roseolus]
MSRFNVRDAKASGTSPIKTTDKTTTHEGGAGYLRDEKSELFLLAVANLVSQQSFYETGKDRDDRYAQLVARLAVQDPDWTAALLGWLRGEGNMRTAAVVGATEYVKARLDKGIAGGNRKVVDSVLQRPDEPGELLAYWTSRYGRSIPKPVKRGTADAVRRLYNERALLKYDTASHAYRFGDVIELTHPTPTAAWQGDLFKHAIDRRHQRVNTIPASLGMLGRNALLRAEGDPGDWLNADALREAGMTWEDALSAVGSKVDKARLWEAMIPSMGYMALLRNLRNFDEAGVSDAVAAGVAARLADPAQVAKSRQFPMRFLSAYRAAPSLRWAWALEQAISHSLAAVPALAGRTLILVDRSGSMFYDRVSDRSDLTRADAAAVFGSALALRAEDATLVEFGTNSARVAFRKSESLLPMLDRFHGMGGTNTVRAIQEHFHGHDRVVIVTDEQAYRSYYGSAGDVIPASVPLYTWNLAGYRAGHVPSGGRNRHTFGGLTDAAFRMIPLLEAGRNAAWPWEQ